MRPSLAAALVAVSESAALWLGATTVVFFFVLLFSSTVVDERRPLESFWFEYCGGGAWRLLNLVVLAGVGS